MDKKYYNSKELVERLSIPRTTIYEWANDGTLPAVIIPHGKKSKYLFPKEEVEKTLERYRNKVLN